MGFLRQSIFRSRRYRRALTVGAPTAVSTPGSPTTTVGTGNVLEMIAGMCDGSTFETLTGSHTFENVTGAQSLPESYTNVNGSKISYTPPEGTNRLIYEFHYQVGWYDSHSIHHLRFYIDGVECTSFRTTNGGQYKEGKMIFKCVIECRSSIEDIPNGKLTSWTDSKELKLQARDYSTGNELRLHQTQYWDGGGTDMFSRPSIYLTAIG